MKLCKLCLNQKEITEFYKHPWTKDWYLSYCKDCKRLYARTNRSKESDKIRYWTNPQRRLWTIYRWIQGRCYDRNNNHYKRYWNRWIKNEWNSYKEFKNDMMESFIISIKEKWVKETSIDRIDNDWNYCKENCKRSTRIEQANNRSSSIFIEYLWEKDTLPNICRKHNLNYWLVRWRIQRWRSIEKSITHPNKI